MQYKLDQLSIFSKKQNDHVTHMVFPTSVEHQYNHQKYGQAIRNALYVKKYEAIGEEQNPIVFFHGGPNIVNNEQFSNMQNYFSERGHAFYIPEIEGSGLYSTEKSKPPKGFDVHMIPSDLKLLELKKYGETGLNEFTQNYADDVKDVLIEVSKKHPNKKIQVITHSLGGHQFLRTLQRIPELTDKIHSICNIAGTCNVGANRFWNTFNATKWFRDANIYLSTLETECTRFFKSDANQDQPGPTIDALNNPAINQKMNEEFSVLYGAVKHFPPLLLMHATDDKNVFFQGSVLLQDKIKKEGGIVHGVYFTEGEHQFIKNEGNLDIQKKAFAIMDEFFKQPEKEYSNDISQFQYDDIIAEHQKFMQDTKSYLKNKFGDDDEELIEESLTGLNTR